MLMKKFILYTILFLFLDILLIVIFALLLLNDYSFQSFAGSVFDSFGIIFLLIIQFIIGLTFLDKESKKELGKAMLLSSGIIFLVGLSVCNYN